MRRAVVRTGAVVVLAGLALGTLASTPSTGAPGTGAPAAQPQVDRAPRLPRLPDVSESGKGRVIARSVPAAASVASGEWTVWAGGGGRLAGTTMSMPPAGGIPLLGDWNGDGVATPGRYEAGQWFVTNASVDAPQWEGKAAFGGDPADVPVVGRIDKDRRTDIGVFRAGEWRWQRANGKPSGVDQFGQAGDVPVVGDWDGDGRDDLGVVRGDVWLLRLTDVNRKPTWVGKQVDITWSATCAPPSCSSGSGRRATCRWWGTGTGTGATTRAWSATAPSGC